MQRTVSQKVTLQIILSQTIVNNPNANVTLVTYKSNVHPVTEAIWSALHSN